jgi:hypothetical protein
VPLDFLQILFDDYHVEEVELKVPVELIGEDPGQFLWLAARSQSLADTQYGFVALGRVSRGGGCICAHIVLGELLGIAWMRFILREMVVHVAWTIQLAKYSTPAVNGPARPFSPSGSLCRRAIDTFDLQHFVLIEAGSN